MVHGSRWIALLVLGLLRAPRAAAQTSPHTSKRVGVECAGAGADVAEPVGIQPPHGTATSFRRVTMPPVPRSLQDSFVVAQFHVTSRGTVDTVILTGLADSSYARRLRRDLMDARFKPATVGGCPVAAWLGLDVTLRRGRP